VKIADSESGRTRLVSVDADGRFSARLKPGKYAITGRSPQYNGGHVYDCQAQGVAVVKADRTLVRNVVCIER
jgi:hypothetical protein